MVKPRLYNEEDTTKAAALFTLKKVLTISLKLLHPYMPFITEEIFCSLQDEEESIMVSDWPVFEEAFDFKAEENEVEIIKNAVRNIRNLRADMNVPPSKKASVYVVSEKRKFVKYLRTPEYSLQHLVMQAKYMYRQIKLVLQTMQYLPLSLTQ